MNTILRLYVCLTVTQPLPPLTRVLLTLDHRFLRNYEKIESGETLEFDNALVDVGDAIDKESCFSDRNKSDADVQVIKKGYFPERVYKQPGFAKG